MLGLKGLLAEMKAVRLFAIIPLLLSPLRSADSVRGIVAGDVSYPASTILVGPLTVAGAVTALGSLDGNFPVTVAGDVNALANVGSAVPIGPLTVSGSLNCDSAVFNSDGKIIVLGNVEFRRPGAKVTARSWSIQGSLHLSSAGTYTIEGAQGPIVVVGKLHGPLSGVATLRIISSVPVSLPQALPSNIDVQIAPAFPPIETQASFGGGRFANVSTRLMLTTEAPSVIVGFVVKDGARNLLLRAIGPGLTSFGVGDAIPDPIMELYDGDGKLIPAALIWSQLSPLQQYPIATASSAVGAFPLSEQSNDSVASLRLSQGAYTVRVSSARAMTGTVLVEAYEVP